MKDLSTQDWKTFLNARIAQEQGDDKKALDVFEQLMTKYPENNHLKSARAFALERLGQGDLAVSDRISLKYEELGRKLVGDKDKPEIWASELSTILEGIESRGVNKSLASAGVVW